MMFLAGVYSWTTFFRETSGKAGFIIKGVNFHITDAKGTIWNTTGKSFEHGISIEVKRNGKYDYPYWCTEGNGRPKFTNYNIVWAGEDDWGNEIRISQSIRLE